MGWLWVEDAGPLLMHTRPRRLRPLVLRIPNWMSEKARVGVIPPIRRSRFSYTMVRNID